MAQDCGCYGQESANATATINHGSRIYCIVLCCIVLSCIALCCVVLYYNYCIVLCYIIIHNHIMIDCIIIITFNDLITCVCIDYVYCLKNVQRYIKALRRRKLASERSLVSLCLPDLEDLSFCLTQTTTKLYHERTLLNLPGQTSTSSCRPAAH